ncbi:MAG: protein kinase [Planctomycetes bacterium]|nr:protein kinase [Planctomycetota bacterium]
MSGTDPGLQQLARALELVQAHRRRPLSSDETLLAAHPELRELLEALLEEQPADGAHESPAAPDEPRVLGDFRLLRELGRGGMGVVYEALQLSLHRRVALKVLAGNRLASPTALVRFRREAELLAQLQHDHLVPVFASGEADGEHFFAMERVDGCSLATVLREFSGTASATLDGDSLAGALRSVLDDPSAGARLAKRSHAEAALSCVLPIFEALAHAHAHGVVHRDVKPANILLRRDGTPLLGDFGLARNLDTPGLTLTGDFAGTPHYVAPEQVESKSGGVDHRVDVFSLGTTLYELLTLHRAFDGPSTQAVLAQVLRAEPTAPRRHGVVLPDDLLAVLDHALEKAPDERYQTMAEFAADLRAVLSLRPVSVRRPGPATRLRRFVRREPLRAALVLLLAIGVPALLSLSVYLWVQQPRIAAAAASETRQRVEELLEDAFLELGEGDPRRTLERATAARALLPDLPECTVALVLAHESLGDPTAQTLREELRQSQPELYRELLGAHSDTVTATEKLTPQPPLLPQATTATPVSALGYYVRGMRWLHFAHDSGDHAAYEHAAESLRQAVFRAPTARALYHCQYLHALFHLGDAPATEAFADVVAAAWPDSPVVWYWIGFALEDSRPERALRLQQRVVEARPDLVLPLASIARIHERAQHDEQAVACYRRMLTIRADDPSALIGLARTLVQVGRAAEALTVAERAVTVAPVSHMAHLAKAAALLALDQPVPARASAERALELVSVNPECHLLLANILLALDDPDGALAATVTRRGARPRGQRTLRRRHARAHGARRRGRRRTQPRTGRATPTRTRDGVGRPRLPQARTRRRGGQRAGAAGGAAARRRRPRGAPVGGQLVPAPR